jgi:hypothetical protein
VWHAHGAYVLFVDADDFVDPTYFERMYTAAVKDDSDLVVCNRTNFYEAAVTPPNGREGQHKTKIYTVGRDGVDTEYGIALDRGADYIPVSSSFIAQQSPHELLRVSPFPWDKLYRIELIRDHPYPEGVRFEDLAVMVQVCAGAKRISVVKKNLYFYRKSSTTSFLNGFTDQTLDIVRACRFMIDDCRDRGIYDIYAREIEFLCIKHMLLRFGNCMHQREHRFSLKCRLVKEIFDLLKNNFPKYKHNGYLQDPKYAWAWRLVKRYSSRTKCYFRAFVSEFMPSIIIRIWRYLRYGKKKPRQEPAMVQD